MSAREGRNWTPAELKYFAVSKTFEDHCATCVRCIDNRNCTDHLKLVARMNNAGVKADRSVGITR